VVKISDHMNSGIDL